MEAANASTNSSIGVWFCTNYPDYTWSLLLQHYAVRMDLQPLAWSLSKNRSMSQGACEKDAAASQITAETRHFQMLGRLVTNAPTDLELPQQMMASHAMIGWAT